MTWCWCFKKHQTLLWRTVTVRLVGHLGQLYGNQVSDSMVMCQAHWHCTSAQQLPGKSLHDHKWCTACYPLRFKLYFHICCQLCHNRSLNLSETHSPSLPCHAAILIYRWTAITYRHAVFNCVTTQNVPVVLNHIFAYQKSRHLKFTGLNLNGTLLRGSGFLDAIDVLL